jgi:hypothetical protein
VRCRGVSVDAAEERLPDALPVAVGFSDGGLARGKIRRVRDGTETWCSLHRLLLVSHGAAVCGGRDEYVVGGHHFDTRAAREGSAKRTVAGKNRRRVPGWLGRLGNGGALRPLRSQIRLHRGHTTTADGRVLGITADVRFPMPATFAFLAVSLADQNRDGIPDFDI